MLRAVCALSAVAALAYCAYAGGQTRGAPPAAQAPRGGVTLKVIRSTATTGKPTVRGPSANVGQTINLVGTGFDGNVSVQFTAFANSTFTVVPLKVNNKKVSLPLPGQVVTGPVRLVDPESGQSDPLTLQVVPKIDTLTPASLAAGGRLLIDGSGFTPETTVTFKGVTSPVTPAVVSPTRVDLTVPAGAVTGKIFVRTNGGMSKPVKLTIAAAAPAAVAPAPKAAPVRAASTARPAEKPAAARSPRLKPHTPRRRR